MNNDFSEDIKLRKTPIFLTQHAYVPMSSMHLCYTTQHAPMLHYPACNSVPLPSKHPCSATQLRLCCPTQCAPLSHAFLDVPHMHGYLLPSMHQFSPTQHAPVFPYPACTCLPVPSMHLSSPTQHAPVFPYPACTSFPLPSMHRCSPTQHAPVFPYPACISVPLPSMHQCSPTQYAPVFPYPACTSVPLPSRHL